MKKLSVNDIKEIVDDASQAGYSIVVGDIMYVVAIRSFQDMNVVYTAIFGKKGDDAIVKSYDKSKKIKFLKDYITKKYILQSDENDETDIPDDISFDENKAYMLALKKKTEDGIKNGSIKQDKGIEILSKLSIALNDKFAVSEKQDEQRVVVNIKYNHICEWTRKECFLQTKEYAMQKWNLVEANKEEDNNEYRDKNED